MSLTVLTGDGDIVLLSYDALVIIFQKICQSLLFSVRIKYGRPQLGVVNLSEGLDIKRTH